MNYFHAEKKNKRILVPLLVSFSLSLTFAFETIAKSKPDFEKKLSKGYHHLQIGNTDKAIKIFEGYVKKHPESGACHTALGRALKRRGKFQEAKEEFKKATQVEPKYGLGFYYLGVALEQDKEWKKAADAFQNYVNLEPDVSKRKIVEDRIRHCKNQI